MDLLDRFLLCHDFSFNYRANRRKPKKVKVRFGAEWRVGSGEFFFNADFAKGTQMSQKHRRMNRKQLVSFFWGLRLRWACLAPLKKYLRDLRFICVVCVKNLVESGESWSSPWLNSQLYTLHRNCEVCVKNRSRHECFSILNSQL